MSEQRPAEPARIRAGEIWDQRCEEAKPSAVLVFHGMGQQVKFETISTVAGAIQDEARQQGGVPKDLVVHLSRVEDRFVARAEVAWQDAQGGSHEVHVYEAYWAPLTEGRVTYWDTLTFLFQAGWNGLVYSWPFGPRTFHRWMFGGPQKLPIGAATFPGLLAVLAVLLMQFGVIVWVSVRLAQLLFAVISAQAMPQMAGGEWPMLGIAAIAAFVLYRLMVQYVGDVAAYVSPYKSSKFDELRKRIQQVGWDAGKLIYGLNYSRILMVGHSLGSVLAYDTLNALINFEQTGPSKPVLARTPALITFGSPLDKTAFIFRVQREDWIREQMAAAMQPLIVDYDKYRPDSFTWVNIWSRQDVVSGALDYYDRPDVDESDPRHAQNVKDPDANIPLRAHVQYWNNPTLRKLLYRFLD
jgi:hypothetical protein